jgi:hypothetical protein
MSLLTIVVVLIVVGVLLWLVNSYIPMDGKIKTILNVVVVIFLIIWLLNAVGAFHYLGSVRI